jgi:hypothetical protein
MGWEDILKAPFDTKLRQEGFKIRREGQRKLDESQPKEDLSTDISSYASNFMDKERSMKYGDRFFAHKGDTKNPSFKLLSELIEKYGKDKLEEVFGELYNNKVFITHRDVGNEYEDYVIDFGKNYEKD